MNNIYTRAIDGIHAPESAVERAIREAAKRVGEPPAIRNRARIIAAAACFVLVSAAAVTVFAVFGNRPPVETKPSEIAVTEATSSGEKPTEAQKNNDPTQKVTEATSAAKTEKPTATAETETNDTPGQTENKTETKAAEQKKSPTEAATQRATEKTTKPTTKPAATEAQPTEDEDISDIIDIDFSQVCDDGKVYCTIAETGLTQIDDPEAFTDDHLIIVVTKWETKVLKNPKYQLEELLKKSAEKSGTWYYYNSNGDILRESPVND